MTALTQDDLAPAGNDNTGPMSATGTAIAETPVAAPSLGVLLGVGDSWINNTKIQGTSDFKRALASLGYDTSELKYGREGITLRELAAFPINVTDQTIYRALKKAIINAGGDSTKLPKALLVSAAGNDIHVKVNDYGLPPKSPMSPLAAIVQPAGATPNIDAAVLTSFVDGRLRNDLIRLLDQLLKLMNDWGGQIPIVLHGYDYPIPDGINPASVDPKDSWLNSIITLERGHPCDPDGRNIMIDLIDKLNGMMTDLATKKYAGRRVIHARLTGTLKANDPRQDWLNELHPTESGYGELAKVLRTFIPD